MGIGAKENDFLRVKLPCHGLAEFPDLRAFNHASLLAEKSSDASREYGPGPRGPTQGIAQ
jgi:hypothetical protein